MGEEEETPAIEAKDDGDVVKVEKTEKKEKSKAKAKKAKKSKKADKKGTVLTHTINKISQSPNAKLLQHGKSHTTSTSHQKQGARKKRSTGESKSKKKGSVLTHTINKISQTPNAKLLQHGKSHTTSTSHLKQDSARKSSLGKLRKGSKKGTVIQHTISRVAQSPNAKEAQHGL